MEAGTQFEAIDRAALTPVVRRALGRPTAELDAWEVRPLGDVFNPITGGLCRVRGTARAGGAPLAWSVFLKVCRDPGQQHPGDARAGGYWKREFLAYSSGVLDDLPGGLRAPRCYGAEERPDGGAWLWLEDLADAHTGPWPLERYGLAARHAGRFGGAYLSGRPLPAVPWLSAGVTRGYAERGGAPIERLPEFADHPLVRRAWPDPGMAGRVVRLWREREAFLGALARLPQTLTHLDLFKLNLFAVRGPDGRDETVAVDWAFLGTAGVGEELAPLVYATAVLAREHADRTRELGETCFDGYLAGLRDAGWVDEARLARLGYAAGMLRYSLVPLALWAVVHPETVQRYERTWGPFGEMLDRGAAVLRYTLDLADEARELMRLR